MTFRKTLIEELDISVTYTLAGDCEVYYVTEPFDQEPGFGVTSINYDLGKLLQKGGKPWPH